MHRPPGEAKFDGEIIRMLYEYKGLPYNVIPGYPEYPSVEEMLDMSVAGFEPKGWKVFEQRFQEHGWWDCKELNRNCGERIAATKPVRIALAMRVGS